MARKLDVIWRPVDYQTLINGAILALDAMIDMYPNESIPISRDCLRLGCAQMAIECGLVNGKGYSPNYCLSGMKTSPNNVGGYSWQYFRTRELYTAGQLADAISRGPVQKIGPVKGKPNLTEVMLLPEHPYCCFRAFETLEDAMLDHFTTIRRKWPKAFVELLAGSADNYAHELKAGGYYTALESQYAGGLKWRLNEEARLVLESNVVWGDIQ
jgi:hypothetical protein